MFASSKLKNHKSSDNKQRLFRYTEIIDRNFAMHFKPIPKIRAIHQTIVNSAWGPLAWDVSKKFRTSLE
jgi:hypothetical protein